MTEDNLEIRGTIPALLVFADIVDSSTYSAVLGRVEYAKRLLDFQRLFKMVGRKYFPEPSDSTQELCQIDSRGDEGIIFVACTESDFSELVFKAIEFIYHLKGLLRFGSAEQEEDTSAPRQIGLGAGIHVGKVAFATICENNRSVIKHIEGFSINYAKRVESCSRLGKYSRVFLSKEAAKLLEDKPVILSCSSAPMKGIKDNEEVYEVRSGLFDDLKLDLGYEADERLVEQIEELADQPMKIEEPWIKALVISILDYLIKESLVANRKGEYRKSQSNLAWHSSIEEDPILLYLRARGFEEKKQHTQQLRYLKQIVNKHPDFVHARKRLIRACWAIARKKSERSELVFARDLAKEFLDKFPRFLSDEEKEEFQKLVKTTSAKTKSKE
ncbi:MAG: hypothetical protein KAV87_18875 [Desulfobacteraceae bacterium]|nr:hypothetical protein [Desulfobacteraceae bacterium]